MIIFWLIVVTMIVVALFFVLRPLRIASAQDELKQKFASSDITNIVSENNTILNQQQQNIRITRERLAELKNELEQGIINEASYEQSRMELELTLLSDIETNAGKKPLQDKLKNESVRKYTLRLLLLIIPVFSLAMYAFLGQPGLINNQQQQASASMPEGHGTANGKLPSIEVMVEKLAKKLQQEPGNAEGWYMLGRSYMSLGQYENAVSALEKTRQLMPGNPTVMLRYADALTMLNGGRIQGKPFELIKQALKLSPDDATGLWLAGMGYEEQGEYDKALSHWNRLLPLLDDEKSIAEVRTLIRQTQQKAGIAVSEKPPVTSTTKITQAAISLKVHVSLDKALVNKVNENDTVFIFAKAVNGPPMPLAVVRKQVKDLPLQVTLDDSMAMMPTMKLSSFKQVRLVARISRSGQPLAQAGDYSSKEQIVQLPSTENITIYINTITK